MSLYINKNIHKNIHSGSRNLPNCSPYWGCLLRRKSIPVVPWPRGTHSHSGRQHPSVILGVYDRSGV